MSALFETVQFIEILSFFNSVYNQYIVEGPLELWPVVRIRRNDYRVKTSAQEKETLSKAELQTT